MLRRRIPELMDDPRVDPREHEHALRALNRVNRLCGIDCRLLREIRHVGTARELAVLDLGAGGGGFLAYLRAQTAPQTQWRLVGLDSSPQAVSLAHAWHNGDIQFVVGDARQMPFEDGSFDVVTCSLFLHHFADEEVERILREAARIARRGVVVGDLSRSWTAWCATWVTTRLLSRARLFHVDGPRSVRAAYRADEMLTLTRRAGLHGARVRAWFPFRFVLTWSKPEAGNGQP